MKYITTFGTFLTLISGLLSCEKKRITDKEMQRLWDCHASQKFDSAKLAEKLVDY